MSRPVGLSLTLVSAARTITGSPSADSTSLTDENFPPVPDNILGGALNAFGFSTVLFGVEFTGGSAPTIEIELLFRDANAASDGNRWKRVLPNVPITLDGTGLVEFSTYGTLLFPRLVAVTGAPTGITILAFPGRRQPGRAFY